MPLSKIVANSITDDTITTDQIADTSVHGRRNIIQNGAMQIAQRGTSSTTSGYQTVDRFKIDFAGFSVTQSQQSLTSGSPYDEGFRYFVRAANTSVSSGTTDYLHMYQYIEAQNLTQSGWNYVSSASKVTFSFWARSSLAGTYYINLRTQDGTVQAYASAFTLVADTWKKVSFVLPGNSNITINNDNGRGLFIAVLPHYGTHYTTSGYTVDQWAAYSNTNITPDFAQNWGNTANATFDLTGLQLEVGEVSNPVFEHLSFGEELNLCERYFQQYECSGQQLIYFESNTSNHKFTHTNIQRKMRTTPTISLSTNFGHGGGAGGTINSVTTTSIGPDRVSYRVGFTGNIGDQYSLRHSDSFDGDVVSYDAEL